MVKSFQLKINIFKLITIDYTSVYDYMSKGYGAWLYKTHKDLYDQGAYYQIWEFADEDKYLEFIIKHPESVHIYKEEKINKKDN